MSITFQSLSERFHLSLDDQYAIGCCINSYASASWSFSNSLASILNRSEWDLAKRRLAERLNAVFNDYLPGYSESTVAERSQPLSEFFLRLLITKRNAQSENGLGERLCRALDTLPFVEVFERASAGDGTSFPYVSRILLLCQYQRELKQFAEELGNLDALLRREEALAKRAELARLLETTLPIYDQFASKRFLFLSKGLGKANSAETEFLRSLREARSTFLSANQVASK